MKEKILVLGSSSFSGASMVKYLLDKNKYKIYETFRRKKISTYLPYKFSKNFRLFKEYKIVTYENINIGNYWKYIIQWVIPISILIIFINGIN